MNPSTDTVVFLQAAETPDLGFEKLSAVQHTHSAIRTFPKNFRRSKVSSAKQTGTASHWDGCGTDKLPSGYLT